MRSWILPIIGLVTVSILTAGACGGTTEATPASADGATEEAAPRYEAGVPDTYVPYVRTTPLCVAAPYADAGTITGPGFPTDDAGDDDAGLALGPPQLASAGGPVLHNPRIVPVTYAGDELADQIEDFVGSIGCTDYWRQVTSEYGVGQAQMLTPVRLADAAPATITDSQIGAFIVKQIEAGTPGFANPPADVLFSFYFPTTTTIELFGEQSCSSFDGYHSSVRYGTSKTVAYAVMARCGSDDITTVTSTSTHEFVEATTDPNPENNAAYLEPDESHLAFSFLAGGEAGDLCTFNRDADYTPDGYPFFVQRTWSNASILAGHDPCVPAPAGPFLAAIPDQPDSVPVQGFPGSGVTRGIAIPVGGTRTIDLHFHSDDPATTSWNISTNDVSKFGPDGASHLTLTLDRTTAMVGQVAHLTITRNSKSATYGAEPFSVRSSTSTNTASWMGVVGDPQ